jgi:formate hydrogenlyase subunit 3/multisubunit Na+/H+ antiporter MnhD subunit
MMMADIPWIIMVIILPLIGAISCFLWPQQAKKIGLLTAILIVVSTLALIWQVMLQGAQYYLVGGWSAPLGIRLYVDGLSLLMLIISALVGLAISLYSIPYFVNQSDGEQKNQVFWPLWLFLWAALNALFLSADIFNCYVTLELLGLSAVALVALAGSRNALVAAMRYLLVSLLGSLCFLLGVALLYHRYGSVDLALLAQSAQASPVLWSALALMSLGLLLKSALFPFHFWLPAAHGSAPAPVSALLSALVIKASFYLFLRLWLAFSPVLDSLNLGYFLGILGSIAIIWGSIQAIRQVRLKMLIAYSTVAQLGYFFLAFPLAHHYGWLGGSYMLLSHAFAKAAMFMAAGNILYFCGHDRITELHRVAQGLPLTLSAFALAGISIMGLPPSGGFVAKWLLLSAALDNQQWGYVVVLLLGSLLASAYIFKVIGHAFTPSLTGVIELKETTPVPWLMEWSALLLAVMAILLGLFSFLPLNVLTIGAPFITEVVIPEGMQ